MLQQVLENIHNYFIKTRHQGTFEIKDGMITLPLLEHQRFWLVGSLLNDGVYTYHPSGITDDDDKNVAGLQDETFTGTVCALAVPPNVIALSEEITKWVDQYQAALNSPYQSENVIGVYSYTKATGSGSGTGGSGAGGTIGWQDVFAGQLNRWRKVSGP